MANRRNNESSTGTTSKRLPTFDKLEGAQLNRDPALAHFLSFEDFLVYNDELDPLSVAAIDTLLNMFKQTLKGKARLWIEGRKEVSFATSDISSIREELDALKLQFESNERSNR
ncbi:uncharacterized protein LOC130012902 [Patella vulgata]|uniref:uncharacterized protein LOC130012902 n=1 Tax=Patella vulgata TaxID=6465 RepID=UPI0024A8A3C6|nr:uncharacterized protein LOC130012902 [Patella vulgata]